MQVSAPTETAVQPQVEASAPVDASKPVLPVTSEIAPDKTSEKLSTLLGDLQSNSRLTSKQLTDLISQLELIQSDFDMVATDSASKEEIISTIQQLNQKQADDIAYLKGMYDRESGTKFFANVGAVLGFKAAQPTFGATAEMGMRIGNGLTIGFGGQYILFENQTFSPAWNIDKLSITGKVGWEW